MSINGTSRFSFSGIISQSEKDTATHQVEEVRVNDGGAVFVLILIRHKAHLDKPFVLASVADAEGKELWRFQQEDFDGFGYLVQANDSAIIALCGRLSGAVERVIPLNSLIGGEHDLIAMLALKKKAAELLVKRYILSEGEKKMVARQAQRQALEEQKHKDQQAQARREAREALAREIRARAPMIAYTSDGRKVFGPPVIETEVSALSTGTAAILVEVGKDGQMEPREWFRVGRKEFGKPRPKIGAQQVTAKSPQATKAAATVQPKCTGIVERKEGDKVQAFEVRLYATKDDVRAACSGTKDGTRVAVFGEVDAPLEVFLVKEGKLQSAGNFTLVVA